MHDTYPRRENAQRVSTHNDVERFTLFYASRVQKNARRLSTSTLALLPILFARRPRLRDVPVHFERGRFIGAFDAFESLTAGEHRVRVPLELAD